MTSREKSFVCLVLLALQERPKKARKEPSKHMEEAYLN